MVTAFELLLYSTVLIVLELVPIALRSILDGKKKEAIHNFSFWPEFAFLNTIRGTRTARFALGVTSVIKAKNEISNLISTQTTNHQKTRQTKITNNDNIQKTMSASSIKPEVHCMFHEGTSTCTYIVKDPESKNAMIIDPVMDFDPIAVRTTNAHNSKVVSYCESHDLSIRYIIETHVHADHMTGANFLKDTFPGAQTAIGENVTKVQSLFKGIFNLNSAGDNFEPDGKQFDLLLKDGEELDFGTNLKIKVLYTPGHTPACVCLVVGDAVFTGESHGRYSAN